MSGSLPFLSFAKDRGARIFVSPNLWVEPEDVRNYPAEEIRKVFLLADAVVCNSAAETRLLSGVFGIHHEKFCVVPNAVDDVFLTTTAAEIFREQYRVRGRFVLNVANVEPRKNQLALIEAMRAFPDHKLIVIGGVRDRAYLEACRNAGGEQFIHIHRLDHHSELLRSAYAACDAFCMPSTVETPGLAALEAAAAGAKVVITEKGSAPEYFLDHAWYVDHKSIPSIIDGLRGALTKHAATHGGAMLDRIRNRYRWKHAAQALAQIYMGPSALAQGVRGLGFYGTEIDDAGDMFHWGREDASLVVEAGRLDFDVQVLQPCKMKILGEEDETLREVELDANRWVPIALRFQGPAKHLIRFVTSPDATTSPNGDPRRLCLAVKRLLVT